ncbi:MAG: hypothetical protein LUF25_02400 [Phascolarctobacterium sp.]|nr:hypothetical protein [Phascolarctobacterium sp.]
MSEKQIMCTEDMNQIQLAEHIIEMLHRMMVHHTLWFKEVEHQIGFENALKAMDYAWINTRKISENYKCKLNTSV